MLLTGVIATGVASWLVTPWIQMSRRGTIDAQTVATWREHPARASYVFADVELPTPRASLDASRLTA